MENNLKKIFRGFILGIVLLPAAPAAAQQETRAKVGLLSCQTSASLGLLVGSRQRIRCIYKSNDGKTVENYVGRIGRLGLDIGVTAGGILGWGVYAPTSGYRRYELVGRYVGASGDISLGLGVGANALVGGSHRTIMLQPLSVEGQVGINLALGVAALTLEPGQ